MGFKYIGFSSMFEELRRMYPTWYHSIYEMMEILKANGRVLDDVLDLMNDTYDNAFIDTMDEKSVIEMEEFIGIVPDSNDTMEQRKNRIKMHFIGYGKMSATFIKNMVNSMIPDAETEVTFLPFDEEKNNLLSVTVSRNSLDRMYSAYLKWIFEQLKIRVPAHLQWILSAKANIEEDVTAYVGVAVGTKKHWIPDEGGPTDPTEDIVIFTNRKGHVLVDERGWLLGKTVIPLLRTIGGTVFYDAGDNGAEYTFYDYAMKKIEYDGVESIKDAYYYSVSGEGTKDRFYVRGSINSEVVWSNRQDNTGYRQDNPKENSAALSEMYDVDTGSVWSWLAGLNGIAFKGYDDWFIGSNEINMHLDFENIGDGIYWSSSESGDTTAKTVIFADSHAEEYNGVIKNRYDGCICVVIRTLNNREK